MSRRGGALLAALLAILLLGGLAMLGLSVARVRARAGDRGVSLARARAAALSGVARVEAQWNTAFAMGLPVGVAAPIPGSPAPAVDGVTSHDSLVRLGQHLYLARSVGEHRSGGGDLLAREGVARLLRVEGPGIPDSAAITALGAILLWADSAASGEDAIPVGWAGYCSPPDSARAGVIHGATAPLLGCGSGTCVVGTPPMQADSLLVAGFLDRLPVAGYSALASQPDLHVSAPALTPGPRLVAGRCDPTALDNWGDPDQPLSACGRYFPVVLLDPGVEMVGGVGQGILLAAGDLTVRGDARFVGVILARGQVTLAEQGRVIGGILAEGGVTISGTARAERSRCAVVRAVQGGARPLRRVPRSWWRWP